jgi:hypothetical protein
MSWDEGQLACNDVGSQSLLPPFLLSLIFIKIRVVIAKSHIFRRLWYRQLLTVWDISQYRWEIWICHCVFGFGGDPSYVCWTKVTTGWVVLWFPPNLGNVKWPMAWTIYPSCEKPHARYTTNMRGPTFILVTHFTPKIKIITFINERGKIFPLRLQGLFTTHTRDRCQVGLNTSLEWWKYNKGKPSTQNTSLKRAHNTCYWSQRSPARH